MSIVIIWKRISVVIVSEIILGPRVDLHPTKREVIYLILLGIFCYHFWLILVRVKYIAHFTGFIGKETLFFSPCLKKVS